MRNVVLTGFVALSLVVGCGDDGGDVGTGGTAATGGAAGTGGTAGTGGSTLSVPDVYSFERAGESTVGRTGQITRLVLITDLYNRMQSISDDVLGGNSLTSYDTPQEVFDALEFLYTMGAAADPMLTIPLLADDQSQATYGDFGTARLQNKLAGNDSATDHKEWGDRTSFKGWTANNLIVDVDGTVGGADTPEALFYGYLWTYAKQVSDAATGSFPVDAATPLYITPAGHDLRQLTQKFLLGAINFSQATDDYLDDQDGAEKGLRADNTVDAMADDPYTALEHHWDEGFGYWGAALDYSQYTDDEIAAKPSDSTRDDYENGYHDSNTDNEIDLTTEYNFSPSTNAAKRDRGSDPNAKTDFTGDADLAWRTGRTLITEAAEADTAVDMVLLGAQRDIIVSIWEKVIAATAVHYVNEVLDDMDAIDDAMTTYSFADHAKHWSELKGFALAFQFNPRSPMSDPSFEMLHTLIGDAPVGASDDAPTNDAEYRQDLLDARDIMAQAYGFAAVNAENW